MAILALSSMTSWVQTQSHKLPEPEMTVASNNVPPPGLVVPVDENIYVLVIAGLGLGIYLLRNRKTV